MLVGVGGALGSLVRHGMTSTQLNTSVAVLVLNVAGSFALGSITAWLHHAKSAWHGTAGEARDRWAALLGLGFCGGLTTFSTHMVDVAQRLDSSSMVSAVVSLLVTALLAVAAAAIGYELTRRTSETSTEGAR